MSQLKKVEKILDIAVNDDLEEYNKLIKLLKKKLPFFSGTRMIAAALLKEYLGNISNLEITTESLFNTDVPGKIVFEDVKDGMARLFINVGKNHRLSPGDLIRDIVKKSAIDGKTIGKIDIHSTYSFFEVPEQFAELVLHSFEGGRLKGVPIAIEPAKRKRPKDDKEK